MNWYEFINKTLIEPNIFAAFIFVLIVFLFLLVTLLFLIIGKFRDGVEKQFSKIIGVLLIVVISLFVNNPFIYALSVIIVATLVTELEFIEKVVAILWSQKEYWDYKKEEKASEQQRGLESVGEKQFETIEAPEIASELEEVKRQLEATKNTADYYKMLFHFAKTHGYIFGSQINILRVLKQSNNYRAPKEFIRQLYLRSGWSGSTYSFENYMAFLSSSLFLGYDPKTNEYYLTNLGNLYLQYLDENNLPNRPF
jgi:uncharacterized protein (UPF0335 family)